MLLLYSTQLIEGVTVYGDDSDPSKFYVMPDEPSFRLDPKTGQPVMKFIKYLMPVDRPDGSKGGGFLIFDSVFVISAATRAKVQSALNDLLKSRGLKNASGGALTAQLSLPTFTKGTASLTLLDSGGALVTKIENSGKPSLLGSLICSFTAELSPEGAAVVQGAMSGTGGVVQVAYDLSYTAVLPPITGKVWFNAMQFQSFYQTIDKSGGNVWHGNNTEDETLRQSFINSQSGGVDFDFSGLDPNDPNSTKVKDDILNWGWSQLANAAKSVVPGGTQAAASSGSSTPSSGSGDGSSGSGSGNAPVPVVGANRGDDGMDHVHRNEQYFAAASFYEVYHEKDSINFSTTQQGTLPNVPNFASLCSTINANDPFFAQIHATVAVNADFAKFNINSVDVSCQYTKSNPVKASAFHFTKPDDIGKFDSDTVNGDMNYSYNFIVNYIDQSQAYSSPTFTQLSPQITVDVGALGIFHLDIFIGSVDFAKTPQVQVAVKYPDPDASGQPISRQFSFDQSKKADSLIAVILKTVDKPYQYQITYVMADGTQVIEDWQSATSAQLYINTPFSSRTISFVSEGDFVNNVDNIFLRMTYNDAINKYQQSADYTFTAQNRSHDWTFPVLGSGQGTITYSGVVSYKNHTTENIPETTNPNSLITFGPPNQLAVTVSPDAALIDFTQVKLIQVNFEYADAANNIDVKQEITLKSGSITPASWTFYARDASKTAYTYQATYYLATNPPSVKKLPAATSSDTDLVLMMPS